MRIIFVGILCLVYSIGSSQQTVWGPSEKIKNSFNQKILGESENSVFVLASDRDFNSKNNTLLIYSNGLILKKQIEPVFSNKIDAFIDAFVKDDVLRVMYFNKKSILIVDEFNFEGNLVRSNEIVIPDIERSIIRNMGEPYVSFKHFKSEDNLIHCISQNDYFVIINDKLDIVRRVETKNNKLMDMQLTATHAFYTFHTDEEIIVNKSDYQNKDEQLNLTLPRFKHWDFKLEYSVSEHKLFMTSLFSDYKRGDAEGLFVNLIDPDSFTEEKLLDSKFSAQTLQEASNSIVTKGVRGVTYLDNNKCYYDNGRFIFIGEKTSSIYKHNETYGTSHEVSYDQIVIMSFNERESLQKVIKRHYKDTQKYLYMMSIFTAYNNKQLYLAYNQERGKYYLNHYVFDSSLNEKFHEEVNTFELRNVYYGVNEGFNVNNKSILFYGRYRNNVGLGRVTLNF